MADLGTPETSEVTVAGHDGSNKLIVNADGSISVIPIPASISVEGAFSSSPEVTTGTTDAVVLLIRNPAGSGKSMFLNLFNCSAITGGRTLVLRLYKNPTVTAAGTAQTISSSIITASPATSVMEIRTGTTVSANGTLMRSFVTGQFETTSNLLSQISFELEPGNDLLVRGVASGNTSVFGYNIGWVEVA